MSIETAARLLAAHPQTADASVWTMAAVGDAAGITRGRPRIAPGIRRPFGWEPLLYLTCSRVAQADAVETARVLLAAGADLNAEQLITHRFSLTEIDLAVNATRDRREPIWMTVALPDPVVLGERAAGRPLCMTGKWPVTTLLTVHSQSHHQQYKHQVARARAYLPLSGATVKKSKLISRSAENPLQRKAPKDVSNEKAGTPSGHVRDDSLLSRDGHGRGSVGG
ncbi:hypothetical protein [Nonomuraea sp. NPDC048901]|uniref:hypothetical protein n=1 Tax=Nonomuraea sp. NPDC048901 TaxID=3155627 RepID=UPI0033ECFB0F